MRHQIVEDRIWRIIDAKDQVLGRLATQISHILQGKHKPMYLDNMFCGDPIIVVNARHFALTGRKRFNKHYIHHTGYPGGLKKVPIADVMEKRPKDALRLAVKSMLPANRLRDVRLSNLRIYLEDEHDHDSQNPVPVPPAHCGPRLGHGGPPTYAELENWWTENLLNVPDRILNEVVAEVRAELKDSQVSPSRPVGLAQALELSAENELTPAELESFNTYTSAADKDLRENAVIIPSTLV